MKGVLFMGLRFHKKINILPGVDVNVSKSGLGLSVGPKGAKVSVNPKGDVYGNVSIPGTGISYREKLNKNNKKKK
jgi:hypothetical protein